MMISKNNVLKEDKMKSDNLNNYKEVERWIVHYEEVGYHDIFEAECERDAVLQASLEYNIIGVWYYDTILKEDK